MERIYKATGARTQVQVAAALGVRQSSISDAKKRCSIPSDWLLKLYRSHGLNPDWLAEGHEPVYLSPAKGHVRAEALLAEAPTCDRTHARGALFRFHRWLARTLIKLFGRRRRGRPDHP